MEMYALTLGMRETWVWTR